MPPVQSKCALVVAGGTGSRLGADIPKQMLPLFERPILAHTLDRFWEFEEGIFICVVLHPSLLQEWPAFVKKYFPPVQHQYLSCCAGGSSRSESVGLGLRHLQAQGLNHSWVAIHDGVRPFADAALLKRGYDMAAKMGNATAAMPVKSSLRKKSPLGSQAIDRSNYYLVQTPQIFRLEEITECYLPPPSGKFTDDASLAEANGMAIHLFEGSYNNIKITSPEDLPVAEHLLKNMAKKS